MSYNFDCNFETGTLLWNIELLSLFGVETEQLYDIENVIESNVKIQNKTECFILNMLNRRLKE